MHDQGSQSWLRSHRGLLAGVVVAIALIAAAFLVGRGSVSEHTTEIAQLNSRLSATKSELSAERVVLHGYEEQLEGAEEQAESAEEALAAERKINGAGTKQVAAQEYETDFPWGAAGTVGYLTIKPLSFEKQGEKYILTVEAKNESHEPQTPFCASGSVVVDANEDRYDGESIISVGGEDDDCEEVGPGLTGTYEEEFTLPPNAKPVVAAIFGDYTQEEEAKTWELPR